MNTAETLKVLAVLKVAYPAMDSRLSDEEYDVMVALWAEMFADEPYELVGAAVRAFIATDEQGFPPSIGKIKAQIRNIKTPDQPTEAEAVNMILQATRNAAYNATSEFKKMPPILQKLVGSPSQLREWAIADSQTINTVVASNLQRSYKVMAERQRQHDALPDSIKSYISLSANGEMHLLE